MVFSFPPTPPPPLNALWRPNTTGPEPDRDDRELIRQYAGWPASRVNIHNLTVAMNDMAIASEAAVLQVQSWIDEAFDLEADWAGKVADGTAHLGNVKRYKGPAPGVAVTRDNSLRKADVLEWDTSLLTVETEAGGSEGMAGPVLASRIASLHSKILRALGIKPYTDSGSGRLIRS